MSLLEAKGLTMRFGGLTAVSSVDLTIEPGQIVSVIGPNGAGKTTAFNAITGVYNPTAGEVRFDGRSQYRPFRWTTGAGAALMGVLVAGLAYLAASDVNGLFRAAVKRPLAYQKAGEPFSFAESSALAGAYLRGELAVERPRRRTTFQVVSADGVTVLLTGLSESDARAARDRLQAGDVSPYTGDDRPDFERKLAAARDSGAGRAAFAGWLALGGFVLGAAAALMVWKRTRRTTDGIALQGMARTFQNIRLFQNMTVLENVLIGLNRAGRSNVFAMTFGELFKPSARRATFAEARSLLAFVGIPESRANILARQLPYGDQRRLEIARALACKPKLVLLDEPAAGMNPSETVELIELIRRIRDRGVTVLLIEHHMNLVMGISDRIAVLDHGEKIAEGTPSAVRNDPVVIAAYLGEEGDH